MVTYRTLVLPTLIAFLAAGCASTPTSEDSKPAPAPAPIAAVPAARPAESPRPLPVTPRAATPARAEQPVDLSQRSIYYDFDKSNIKDEFRAAITNHARHLAANRGAHVVVEGNSDERGSREYNLALGQRRADSVRSMLKLLGVSDAQVETVSWGEEKPKASGHDESAWAQNRRSDIVYKRMQ